MNIKKILEPWSKNIVHEIRKRTPIAGKGIKIDQKASGYSISSSNEAISNKNDSGYRGPFYLSVSSSSETAIRLWDSSSPEELNSINGIAGMAQSGRVFYKVMDKDLELKDAQVGHSVLYLFIELTQDGEYAFWVSQERLEFPKLNDKVWVQLGIVFRDEEDKTIKQIYQSTYGNIRKDPLINCPKH